MSLRSNSTARYGTPARRVPNMQPEAPPKEPAYAHSEKTHAVGDRELRKLAKDKSNRKEKADLYRMPILQQELRLTPERRQAHEPGPAQLQEGCKARKSLRQRKWAACRACGQPNGHCESRLGQNNICAQAT